MRRDQRRAIALRPKAGRASERHHFVSHNAPLAASPWMPRSVPGSKKSITARALYLAAVANSPSVIRGALLDARDALPARLPGGDRCARRGRDAGILRVAPRWSFRRTAVASGAAGTVMRFPASPASSVPEGDALDEMSRLTRPLGPLLDALVRMGATVVSRRAGAPPFTIRARSTRRFWAQAWVIHSSSSQFLSALRARLPLVGRPLFGNAPG